MIVKTSSVAWTNLDLMFNTLMLHTCIPAEPSLLQQHRMLLAVEDEGFKISAI